MKYEAPLVYDIILDLTPHISRKNPPFSLISAVCGASNDPLFQKPKFMRYLEEYRQLGVYCSRGKVLTPEREEYYEKIRKVKLDRYIRENRDEIDRLMRQKFFDE